MRNRFKRRVVAFISVLSILFSFGCTYKTSLSEMESPGGSADASGSGGQAAATYTYYYGGSTAALPSATVTAGTASQSAGSQAVSSSASAAQSVPSQSAVTQAPVSSYTVTQAPQSVLPTAQSNVASYTPAQVVSLLSSAVNKTKSYTGAVTVHHKESFDSPSVTNVQPGGTVMQPAIDFVIGLVVKPTEEDYQFSGGLATTSEGEQTQLLLPKAAPFSLTADGVASATAAEENGNIHVKVTLKPEQCTSLSQVPPYNSSSIGYLDIASKFSVLKIQEVNIQYPGSTIDALIRPDGYVQSVTYVIRLSAHAKATAMGITGSADFSGNQTEVWNIQW